MTETTPKSWSSADWALLSPEGQDVLAIFAFLEPDVAIPTSILLLTSEELTRYRNQKTERAKVRPMFDEWAGSFTEEGVQRAIKTLLRKGWLTQAGSDAIGDAANGEIDLHKGTVVMSPQAQDAVLGHLSAVNKATAFNGAVMRINEVFSGSETNCPFMRDREDGCAPWAAHVEALLRKYTASREKLGYPMLLYLCDIGEGSKAKWMTLEAIDICCRATPPDFNIMTVGVDEATVVPRIAAALRLSLGMIECASHEPGHGLESFRKARLARQELVDYWDRGNFSGYSRFDPHCNAWRYDPKDGPECSWGWRDPDTGSITRHRILNFWLEAFADLLEFDAEQLMVTRVGVAMSLLSEGKPNEALPIMQAVYEEAMERQKGPPLKQPFITVPRHLGLVLKDLGRLEEAKEMMDETIWAVSQGAEDDSYDTIGSYFELGELLIKMNRLEEALAAHMTCYQINMKKHPTFTRTAISARQLGIVATKQGNMEAAIKYFRDALQIIKAVEPMGLVAVQIARHLQLGLEAKGDVDTAAEVEELKAFVDECLAAHPGLLEGAKKAAYSDEYFDKLGRQWCL